MTETKHACRLCGQDDPNEFYADRNRRDGLHTYCKECCKKRAKGSYAKDPESHKRRHREWVANNKERNKLIKLKSSIGITAEQYAALAKVCVICGSVSDLVVDHSHQSGRIRGMLCASCNKGLGFFKDNPSLLFRAAEYILDIAKPDIFEQTYEPA